VLPADASEKQWVSRLTHAWKVVSYAEALQTRGRVGCLPVHMGIGASRCRSHVLLCIVHTSVSVWAVRATLCAVSVQLQCHTPLSDSSSITI
jgi:hypothetical protein